MFFSGGSSEGFQSEYSVPPNASWPYLMLPKSLKICGYPPAIVWRNLQGTVKANTAFGLMINGVFASDGARGMLLRWRSLIITRRLK